jgi:hypothetical protein
MRFAVGGGCPLMERREVVLGRSSSMPTQLSFDENSTLPMKRTVPGPLSGTSTHNPTNVVISPDAGVAHAAFIVAS